VSGGPDGLDPLRELCALAWSGSRDFAECEKALKDLDLN
jgi:hypothetical protein